MRDGRENLEIKYETSDKIVASAGVCILLKPVLAISPANEVELEGKNIFTVYTFPPLARCMVTNVTAVSSGISEAQGCAVIASNVVFHAGWNFSFRNSKAFLTASLIFARSLPPQPSIVFKLELDNWLSAKYLALQTVPLCDLCLCDTGVDNNNTVIVNKSCA